MIRKVLVVAAPLLILLTGIAGAAEFPEHPSKNAQKIFATLDSLGINSREIKAIIAEADSHVDRGYFYLARQPVAAGYLALRYGLRGAPSLRRLELHYAPVGSPMNVTAATTGIMITYRVKF